MSQNDKKIRNNRIFGLFRYKKLKKIKVKKRGTVKTFNRRVSRSSMQCMKQLKIEIGKKNIETAKKYDVKKCASKVFKLYEKLI